MDQLPPPAPPSDSLARVVGFYAWRDLLRRGPGLPVDVLIHLVELTKEYVPRNDDMIAETEWHIEHVLKLAREAVNRERVARGLFPVLFYVATDTLVIHLYRETADGPDLACETTTPNAICSCGRYVIEQVAPHQTV